MNSLKINEIYKPLFEEKKRYYLVTGGRNSGKSFTVKLWESYKLLQKGNKILDTRYTLTSAKLSIIPEFIEKLELNNSLNYCKANQSDITCVNGSHVLFAGIKTNSGIQTANLKSLQGINIWVLDEAEELTDESIFDKIDLSIRSTSNKNIIVLIMNPTNKEHWIWKRWFDGNLGYKKIEGYKIPISKHNDICHIHTTYHNNIDHIPNDYLNQIERIKIENPEKYRHIILGGWIENVEGAIFTKWEIGKFDKSLPYGYGLDFGFFPDPDACVKVAIDNKKKLIYLDEIFYLNNQGLNDLRESLSRSIDKDKLIAADSAEIRLINDLRASFNIKAINKPPNSVIDNIKLIKDYKLIVTESSQNLIKELNNYCWHDKKSNTPIDNYNHLLDAMRYYFMDKNQKNALIGNTDIDNMFVKK